MGVETELLGIKNRYDGKEFRVIEREDGTIAVLAGDTVIVDSGVTPVTATPSGPGVVFSPEVEDRITELGSGLGVKLLVSVKDAQFGAVGDGVADDTHAIRLAIAFAASNKASVFFPDGVYLVSGNFEINGLHSGCEFFGNGESSIVKFRDSMELGNIYAGWMFRICNSAGEIKNIKIRGLNLDGSKSTISWGTTSYGVVIDTDTVMSGVDVDVTAHDFLTSGVQLFSGPCRVSARCYNNIQHGLGTSIGTVFGDVVEVVNAECYDNGGYGIDISKGRAYIGRGVCRRNGSGGLKYSELCDSLEIGSVLLEDNNGPGLQNTGDAPAMEFFARSIISRRNNGQGVRIASGKIIKIGTIDSINNVWSSPTSTEYGDIYLMAGAVEVGAICTVGSGANGLSIDGQCKYYDIGYLHCQGAQKAAMRVANAGTSPTNGKLRGGRLLNNNKLATAGAAGSPLQVLIAGTAKITSVVIEDGNTTPLQTSGMYFAGGVKAHVDSCHFGTGVIDGNQVFSSTAGTRVTFGDGNTGISLRARGVHTGNGGNTAYTCLFSPPLTSLGGGTIYANVTAASSDAKADGYISTVTTAGATYTFSGATPAGTANIALRYSALLEIQR